MPTDGTLVEWGPLPVDLLDDLVDLWRFIGHISRWLHHRGVEWGAAGFFKKDDPGFVGGFCCITIYHTRFSLVKDANISMDTGVYQYKIIQYI